MTDTNSAHKLDNLPVRGLFDAARRYLRGWRGIVVLATVAIAVGVAFNWSWLVAAGIAPVLLAALPCLAMCALGLCMNRMTGRSCSRDTPAPPTSRVGGAGVRGNRNLIRKGD